ncbi:MAG: Bax inhibitor-1 family protein [Gammaproteobacteria bacterium]|nr:Bax inhibitor-1 family protein [Gammaproteobacteria bacterium]
MEEYDFERGTINNDGTTTYRGKETKERSTIFSGTNSGLGKVFLLMFLGLGITAAIAVVLPMLLLRVEISDPEFAVSLYLGLIIFSAIALVILTIVAHVVCFKKEVGGTTVFLIYSAFMGILMSSIVLMYNVQIVGYAFLCAAGSFGVMALYGAVSKGSVKVMGYIGFGLLGAVLSLTIAYFILSLLGIHYEALYWFISFLGIVMMLAFTAFDVHQAKRLAESGNLNNNLAAYFALQLYTDFIYLFIRILYFLSRFAKKD